MEISAAGDNHKRLRRIARKLLEAAEGGDLSAIKEVADRLDGKCVQQVDTNAIQAQTVVIGQVSDGDRYRALEILAAKVGGQPPQPITLEASPDELTELESIVGLNGTASH